MKCAGPGCGYLAVDVDHTPGYLDRDTACLIFSGHVGIRIAGFDERRMFVPIIVRVAAACLSLRLSYFRF